MIEANKRLISSLAQYDLTSHLRNTLTPAFRAIAQYNISLMSINYKALSDSMLTFVNSYSKSITNIISTPVLDWFRQIDFSPILSTIDSIRHLLTFDFDKQYYSELYLQEMYDARWFPYVGWRNTNVSLAIEINSILEHTRKSKNRVKKIDKAVFNYYCTQEINYIRRMWRESECPSPLKRIMLQSLKAYERKEYALVVIPLCSMWEGIINEKANDTSGKKSLKTKQHFADLIKHNEYEDIFDSYFRDFIFYPCYTKNDVISDVPGRHGIAHSWFNEYPNRKAALNAIMFTDFLLSLDSLDSSTDCQEE